MKRAPHGVAGQGVEHRLIGLRVMYCGQPWLVVRAVRSSCSGEPWLTLLGAGWAQALVKPHEVALVLN